MATTYDMRSSSWSPSWTLNTWGLCSINPRSYTTHTIETWKATWNEKTGYVPIDGSHRRNTYFLPKPYRDSMLTYARVYQLTLNILGYIDFIPHLPVIAGGIRIMGGVLLLGQTLIDRGSMQGNFSDERCYTALAQMVRGCFEIYRPAGNNINLFLDGLGTIYNLTHVGTYCVDYYTGSDRIAYGDTPPNPNQMVEGPDHKKNPFLYLA